MSPSSYEIPNEALRPEHIPSPTATVGDALNFAMTFNGYEALGGFDACVAVADKVGRAYDSANGFPDDLTLSELRAALWFYGRSYRHWGGQAPDNFQDPMDPKAESGDTRHVTALIDAIRRKAELTCG